MLKVKFFIQDTFENIPDYEIKRLNSNEKELKKVIKMFVKPMPLQIDNRTITIMKNIYKYIPLEYITSLSCKRITLLHQLLHLLLHQQPHHSF